MLNQFFSVCFKIFDVDGDGQLNESELVQMVENMVTVKSKHRVESDTQLEECNIIIQDLLKQGNSKVPKYVTMEEFLVWTVDNVLARETGEEDVGASDLRCSGISVKFTNGASSGRQHEFYH